MTDQALIEQFKRLFVAGDFSAALRCVEQLRQRFPERAPLYWHQALCLEKLERFDDIVPVLDQLIALNADYAPAYVMRAKYRMPIYDARLDDDHLSDKERSRLEREYGQRAQQIALLSIADLRRALSLDGSQHEAYFLLGQRLQHDEETNVEGAQLLQKALSLAPDQVSYLEASAEGLRVQAMVDPDAPGDVPADAQVKNLFGMVYDRRKLALAVQQFQRCFELSGELRFAIRSARIWHDMGEFDQAIAAYDQALARLPADDPKRAPLLEQRARSENNGRGEYEQTAQMLEQTFAGMQQGRNRTAEEDLVSMLMQSTAQALRKGQSFEQAMSVISDDNPQTLLVNSVAQQLINAIFEAPPELVSAEVSQYPSYQQHHVAGIAQTLHGANLVSMGSFTPRALEARLGQQFLLGLHRDQSGEIGIAAYALRPKWPGWLAAAYLFVTGQYRSQKFLACVTAFSDGMHFSTQWLSKAAIESTPQLQYETLPANTPAIALLQHHRLRVQRYLQTQRGVRAVAATTLEDIEARWVAGQQAKLAHARSNGYISDSALQKLLGRQYPTLGAPIKARVQQLAELYERE
jgi:tetratricopeptide (TPR) repeat protein